VDNNGQALFALRTWLFR